MADDLPDPTVVTSDLPPFARVPLWAVLDGDLSDAAVRVLALLARYDGMPHGIIPSVTRLADEAGRSPASVRRALHELRDRGAVEVESRAGEHGGQTTNRYRIRFRAPRVTDDTPSQIREAPPSKSDRPPLSDLHPELDRGELERGELETLNTSGASAPTRREDTEEPVPRHKRDPEDVWPSEVLEVTREIAKMIRANGHPLPGAGTKRADSWYDAAEKLLRLGPPGADGAPDLVPTVEDVLRVARWALTVSDFWPANVRALTTFREKYPQLAGQANRQGTNGTARKAADLASSYASAGEAMRARRGQR